MIFNFKDETKDTKKTVVYCGFHSTLVTFNKKKPASLTEGDVFFEQQLLCSSFLTHKNILLVVLEIENSISVPQQGESAFS